MALELTILVGTMTGIAQLVAQEIVVQVELAVQARLVEHSLTGLQCRRHKPKQKPRLWQSLMLASRSE